MTEEQEKILRIVQSPINDQWFCCNTGQPILDIYADFINKRDNSVGMIKEL